MKLSLDQFLEHLDVEIGSALAGTLSCRENKKRLWQVIYREEDRVAALWKEFDYRFVLTPRMMVSPMCGMFYGVGFKVEGEAERKLEEEKSVKVVSPIFKFWPFKHGKFTPKIQTTD